jgi:mRNA interferase RelE/StbE
VKPVRYSKIAEEQLQVHANMALRVQRAISAYAAGGGAHTNQVKKLKGSLSKRLRVGDFRVIFLESDAEIHVIKIAPRGDVYD